MNRKDFFKLLLGIALLPSTLIGKAKPEWRQVLWTDIKEGQVFSTRPERFDPMYFNVKYKEYGWSTWAGGVECESKCTFDPEKSAWAHHKIKVWTYV